MPNDVGLDCVFFLMRDQYREKLQEYRLYWRLFANNYKKANDWCQSCSGIDRRHQAAQRPINFLAHPQPSERLAETINTQAPEKKAEIDELRSLGIHMACPGPRRGLAESRHVQ
nr:hypothetical protein [Pseudomonas sp. Marseille-Q3773]